MGRVPAVCYGEGASCSLATALSALLLVLRFISHLVRNVCAAPFTQICLLTSARTFEPPPPAEARSRPGFPPPSSVMGLSEPLLDMPDDTSPGAADAGAVVRPKDFAQHCIVTTLPPYPSWCAAGQPTCNARQPLFAASAGLHRAPAVVPCAPAAPIRLLARQRRRRAPSTHSTKPTSRCPCLALPAGADASMRGCSGWARRWCWAWRWVLRCRPAASAPSCPRPWPAFPASLDG